VNLVIALAAGFLLVVALIFSLDAYTRHGKITEVPDVAKKNARNGIKLLKSKGFRVVVDSTYRDSLPPLYVIKQVPAGGEKVKQGRTIYLVVNKESIPLIDMPNLIGASVNGALHLLKQLAKNEEIKPGTMIPYGTKITMIIGGGLGRELYNFPDFYGMTLKHALKVLDTMGLSSGAIVPDPGTKDTLGALIWKQYPPAVDPYTRSRTILRQGNVVDFWVSPVARAREVDTLSGTIDQSTVEDAEVKSALEEKNKPKKPAAKLKKPTPPANKPKPAPKPADAKTNGNDY
jgi:beta-lactam-binding protein with PASTA domain